MNLSSFQREGHSLIILRTTESHQDDQFSSVQFSRSVVSDSLRPHEPQHAGLPCPSPTPWVHPKNRTQQFHSSESTQRKWKHTGTQTTVRECSQQHDSQEPNSRQLANRWSVVYPCHGILLVTRNKVLTYASHVWTLKTLKWKKPHVKGQILNDFIHVKCP